MRFANVKAHEQCLSLYIVCVRYFVVQEPMMKKNLINREFSMH